MTHGIIISINGNLISARFTGAVALNEVGYVKVGSLRLLSEIVRIRGTIADMQVFEDTTGLSAGDTVEFTGNLLSVELGPGLIGQIYDGLQNPLPQLAEQCGFFLQRGVYLKPLSTEKPWEFTPLAKAGDVVRAGDTLGSVPEGIFTHRVMVPFALQGRYTVASIVPAGTHVITDVIATLTSEEGGTVPVTMTQRWPVKVPITCYAERLRPTTTLVTETRCIDSFFPVAVGGTFCIPGPFGAGKTVLQQTISRYAEADIVIYAACGERAGEVVEMLREFPHLPDPRTGKTLMDRTIIICNTSSMPVAAREASVYTAATLAAYYRQMGLSVLLLADSTSRWAQALREVSGRLEEIPGEEAFPAYLESVVASFYERAGVVRLNDGTTGALTIGGAVSPAGGNFDEPVTQATLKVVGAFLGLSRSRSDARRFPAIDPLESWSKYEPVVPADKLAALHTALRRGADVAQMMKVVGEEGTSLSDFILYLKSELIDNVYLQQNSFHDVDGTTSAKRQRQMFALLCDIVRSPISFAERDAARSFFHKLTQTMRDWNYVAYTDPAFADGERAIRAMVEGVEARG